MLLFLFKHMCVQQLHFWWIFAETYISRRPLLIFGNTALQVERQVVTVDQDSLSELLFKLTHIWFDARKVQFL